MMFTMSRLLPILVVVAATSRGLAAPPGTPPPERPETTADRTERDELLARVRA